jgi:hypothetical protein
MARPPIERTIATLATIGGLAMMGACGGSSPTAPRPPPEPTPPPTVTFVSDNADATTNSIVLVMTATGTDSFTLTLTANSVTDLFGYALDIVFDPTAITLASSQFGAFLNAEGITVTSQMTQTTPGTLIVGQSRVGAVAGVTGSGALLTLDFTTIAAGSTTIAIENTGAVDSAGAALGTEFVGGTATVPASE